MIVRKIIKWNWIQIIRLLWIIFRYLIFQVSPLLAKTMQRVTVLTANFSSEILGVLSSSKQGPSSLCIIVSEKACSLGEKGKLPV